MRKVTGRAGSEILASGTFVALAFLCLLLDVTLSAQAPKTEGKSGIVRQLAEVRFPAGEGPDCLQFFLENGDMKTGPSTAIMKAKPNCVVPPHYHTAEEQLIIVKGDVSTGMEGMKDAVLGPGGFRHDAQQGAALVHLHRERRMPDVCNVRSRLRHRLDQAQQADFPKRGGSLS